MSCHPVAGEIGVAQLESVKTASELELTLAAVTPLLWRTSARD